MFDEIAARLKNGTNSFRQIDGAADFPSAEAETKQYPAAFLIPLADTPGKNVYESGGVMQRVEIGFGVVIAISRRGVSGGKRLDVLLPYKQEVISKLLGWSPADGFAPIELRPGRLMKIGDTAIWWQMGFATDSYERSI